MIFRLFSALAAVCALSFSAVSFAADTSGSLAESPTTLMGVSLGDNIDAYPKCQAHTRALCWKRFLADPSGEYVYTFLNIPGHNAVERFVYARVTDDKISNVSVAIKAGNPVDAKRLMALMSETAETKWASWQGPHTLGHVKINQVWTGPNDAIAGLGKLPDDPNSALLSLMTQDYLEKHMREQQ